MTPDTRSVTQRAETLDLVKMKSFCSVKDAAKAGKKCLQKTLDKGVLPHM